MNHSRLRTLLQTGLGLLLFLLPWQTMWIAKEVFVGGIKWEYLTQGIYGSEIILWSCALLFIVWFWQQFRTSKKLGLQSLRQLWSPDRFFVVASLALVIYSFFSSLWSPVPEVARQHALWMLEAIVLFFMLVVGPLSSRASFLCFFLGAVVESVLGMYQFLTQSTFALKWLGLAQHHVWQAGTSVVSSPDIGRWLRAYGSFPHPNMLGGYLAIVILLLMILFFIRRKEPNDVRQSRVVFFLLPIVTAALFFSFSRSAWMATGIGVSLFVCTVPRQSLRRDGLLLVGVLVATFVLMSMVFSPLVTTRFDPGASIQETRSISERKTGYAEAVQLWRQRPWLGGGIGQYTVLEFQTHPPTPVYALQPVHNVPLLFLTELGIVGVLFFLVMMGAAFRLIKPIISSQGWFPLVSFVAVLSVLLSVDHYIFSLYPGLLMLAVVAGVALRAGLSTLRPLVIDRQV